MNQLPLITVVTPTYNRGELLQKSIASVLGQTYTNWEYIIVDDGSTDNIREVMKAYTDKRIRYVYQDNQERSAARNNGVTQATGQFICFLDSDDFYLPDHLASFAEEIVKQNYAKGIYYTGHIEEEDGKELSRSKWYNASYGNAVLFAWETLLSGDAVCISRELLLEYKFPVKYNIFEDAHVWLRILSRYPLFQIEKHTVIALEHSDRSINSVFQKTAIDHTKKYVSCINDLFDNYGSLLAPTLTQKMKNDFIRRKILLIAAIGIGNGGPAKKNGRQLLTYLFSMQPNLVLDSTAIKLYVKSFL